jgi:CheY-like chemotaxis protein
MQGQGRRLRQHSKCKTRVLVVDDYTVFANTLVVILNQNGFQATAVYSGEQAVDAARHLHPDILISDVVMDGMNGVDAAILISSILPNCKILLISGQQDPADLLQHARREGLAFEILAKPVSPRTILDRLEN